MKNSLQVLLFAFCFSLYQKIPVERCEIYYLKYNLKEIIKFNKPMMKIAKCMVDDYIKHHHPQIYSQNKFNLENFSSLISKKNKLEDYI